MPFDLSPCRPLILLLIAFICGCSTKSELTSEWRGDPFNSYNAKKVLVVAASYSERERTIFETTVAQALSRSGIPFVASAQALPTTVRPFKHILEEKLDGQGYDTIAVVSILGVDEKPMYKHRPDSQQRHYDSYYRHAYQSSFGMDQHTARRLLNIALNFYSWSTGELVWSGTFHTQSSTSPEEIISPVASISLDTLNENEFLVPQQFRKVSRIR